VLDNLTILAQVPVLNVQLLLDGLIVGAIFALTAYGLALVWGVMNLKNLAQGDFVIMGGYIALVLQRRDGKTIVMVEQNAKKGLAVADVGYVLVSGEVVVAGTGRELLENPEVGRLFLGG